MAICETCLGSGELRTGNPDADLCPTCEGKGTVPDSVGDVSETQGE